MSKFSFFSDLVNTLFDKKNRKKNFSFLFEKKQNKSLLEYVENVNDAKGEISALSYSEDLNSPIILLNLSLIHISEPTRPY